MSETLVISRRFGRLSHATFTIPCVREFVLRYVGDGKGWVDPFAGDNSPAEFTNDENPLRMARWHMTAQEFIERRVPGTASFFVGIIFDPPYSYRQVSEHYRMVGKKATQRDTSYNFYRRVMEPAAPRIKLGGFALSFGWNTNGFGNSLGFEKREILIVGHGGHHNDTLCLAEQKVRMVSR